MSINVRELSLVVSEANALSNKETLTQHETRRLNFLLSAAAAIRSGASLSELEQDAHNDYARASGLPVAKFKRDGLTNEQRDTAQAWQHFVRTPKEQRDTEGAPLPRIGTYNTSGGTFVPTEFFSDVFMQLKAHSPLFDEDFCTVVNSTNGRVLTIPTLGDIENVASVVGEAGSQTDTGIVTNFMTFGGGEEYGTGHAQLGVYAYKTPRWSISLEAFDDLADSLNAAKLFTRFASDRIRRGVGNDLVNGDGSNRPLGLLASLEALYSATTPQIIAAGSSGNTGGNETGANSIGSVDLSNLYYSVDSAYRSSDKCAWLMSDATLNAIDSIVTKYGQKLDLVKYIDGEPFILGKPVYCDPSMQGIGASNTPIVFGDFSYWVTSLVTGVAQNGMPIGYVQSYKEAPGLIELGKIGFRAFFRAGGALAVNDRNSPSPLNYISNHS